MLRLQGPADFLQLDFDKPCVFYGGVQDQSASIEKVQNAFPRLGLELPSPEGRAGWWAWFSVLMFSCPGSGEITRIPEIRELDQTIYVIPFSSKSLILPLSCFISLFPTSFLHFN